MCRNYKIINISYKFEKINEVNSSAWIIWTETLSVVKFILIHVKLFTLFSYSLFLKIKNSVVFIKLFFAAK